MGMKRCGVIFILLGVPQAKGVPRFRPDMLSETCQVWVELILGRLPSGEIIARHNEWATQDKTGTGET